MDEREAYHNGLRSVSPLSGREILFCRGLEKHLSEAALHRNRAIVEVENLIALSESDLLSKPQINEDTKNRIRTIANIEFDPSAVADYDHFGKRGKGPFEHDVKSVEVYLREKFDEDPKLRPLMEFIHFPMTSEDVNNIAYNLMLRDAVNDVWMPRVLEVGDQLSELSERYAHTPVIGKTHGMNASPTTMGKRFAYHLDKLTGVLEVLRGQKLKAKFSGPVGNHNAMQAVLPDFDFESYARRLVERFGFEYSSIENQRISHQSQVELLNNIQLVNLIGADLSENVRHNVMMDWMYLEGNPSHVGSSVMPHKINPWLFEVGQGYFEISDTLINGSRSGLIQSVLERDLTDHPWERMYGEMIGYSLVGLSYLHEGLPMLRVDEQKCLDDLSASPEVLSEAVQIAGRTLGVQDVYMKIKEATRGKKITIDRLREVIHETIPEGEMRDKLMRLSPAEYIGKAPELVYAATERYKSLKSQLVKGILGAKK